MPAPPRQWALWAPRVILPPPRKAGDLIAGCARPAQAHLKDERAYCAPELDRLSQCQVTSNTGCKAGGPGEGRASARSQQSRSLRVRVVAIRCWTSRAQCGVGQAPRCQRAQAGVGRKVLPKPGAMPRARRHFCALPHFRSRCDAHSESARGHLQRMDGTGAVSGPTPIATVLLWPATHAPGQNPTNSVADTER